MVTEQNVAQRRNYHVLMITKPIYLLCFFILHSAPIWQRGDLQTSEFLCEPYEIIVPCLKGAISSNRGLESYFRIFWAILAACQLTEEL